MRRRDIVTSPSAARRAIVDAPMPRSSSDRDVDAIRRRLQQRQCFTLPNAQPDRRRILRTCGPASSGNRRRVEINRVVALSRQRGNPRGPVSVRRPFEWLGDADQAVALEREEHSVRAARMTLNRGAGGGHFAAATARCGSRSCGRCRGPFPD